VGGLLALLLASIIDSKLDF